MTVTRDPLAFQDAACRTPEWATRAILPRLLQLVPEGAALLDAGCGTGAIAEILANAFRIVHGIDTRPVRRVDGGVARWSGHRGDFLAPMGRTYGAVVSNPPFALPGWGRGRYDPAFDGVLRFTRRALEVAPVACILHRSGWWHEQQPGRRDLRADLRAGWVTERWALGRIDFFGHLSGAEKKAMGLGSGDSTPYAWLIARRPTKADGAGPWPTAEHDCEARDANPT